MTDIEVFEGDRATHYDDFVATWIPCYHTFISLLPDLLLSNKVEQAEILIAGCGTGNEIQMLADASNEWQLTGIDPSPEMIAQAKKKLSSYANISLINGVVADLSSPQYKQYDAATLLLVLHFLEDKSKLALLKDIATRLKPQASLITFDITGNHDHVKQNLQVLARLLPKNMDKEVVEFRLNRMQNSLHPVSDKRFTALCLEAGFTAPTRFFQSTVYTGWMLEVPYQ